MSYKIFSIEPNTASVGPRTNGLIEATYKTFPDIGAAEDWIRTEGASNLEYVILEVYKKP